MSESQEFINNVFIDKTGDREMKSLIKTVVLLGTIMFSSLLSGCASGNLDKFNQNLGQFNETVETVSETLVVLSGTAEQIKDAYCKYPAPWRKYLRTKVNEKLVDIGDGIDCGDDESTSINLPTGFTPQPFNSTHVASTKEIKMNEHDLEKEIQKKGLNAPRLTPDHIDSVITDTQYHVFPGTQHTVCLIKLKNDATVAGESVCASPENFDKEIGEQAALADAKRKIWPLEGYLLKDQLHRQTKS